MARHRHHRSRHHSKKNIVNKTLDKSVSFVKSTSKKYMPKVKSGLENVGSNVIKKGSESVPYLQKLTRKFFGLFGINKTKKNRRH
jgi:hypothetical protein